jgi:Lon protease-like protein
MLVEFPFFAAGINNFPGEISALRVFEPRYLLLIGDSIIKEQNFLVGRNLEEIHQIVSEVEIIEHQDISNAEQLVIVETKKLHKVKNFNMENEYPICYVSEHTDVGLPPNIDELDDLEKNIKKMTAKLIEQGLNTSIPEFLIDSENRFNKLWELCIYTPMDINTKNLLISENDISKRFELLYKYVENMLKA